MEAAQLEVVEALAAHASLKQLLPGPVLETLKVEEVEVEVRPLHGQEEVEEQGVHLVPQAEGAEAG